MKCSLPTASTDRSLHDLTPAVVAACAPRPGTSDAGYFVHDNSARPHRRLRFVPRARCTCVCRARAHHPGRHQRRRRIRCASAEDAVHLRERQVVQDAVDQLAAAGIDVHGEIIEATEHDVADIIVQRAKELDVDIIVLGYQHHRGSVVAEHSTSAFLASQPQRLTVDDEACMGELASLGHTVAASAVWRSSRTPDSTSAPTGLSDSIQRSDRPVRPGDSSCPRRPK